MQHTSRGTRSKKSSGRHKKTRYNVYVKEDRPRTGWLYHKSVTKKEATKTSRAMNRGQEHKVAWVRPDET